MESHWYTANSITHILLVGSVYTVMGLSNPAQKVNAIKFSQRPNRPVLSLQLQRLNYWILSWFRAGIASCLTHTKVGIRGTRQLFQDEVNETLKGVTPSLALTHRVLVFDWTFSGAVKDPNLYDSDKYSSYESFADDLIALLDEFRLRESVFMGHSMSGMIGCIASIKRPDLFKRLILIAASPRYLNANNYEGGFERPVIDEIFTNIESNFEEWVSHFAPLVVGANDPLSVDKVGKCMRRMRPETALPLAKTVFCSDHRDILDKVTTPCTIVQPTNDVAAPMSVAQYMQRKIKGKTTVEIIDMDGHFPHLTAHVQLLNVVDSVLVLSPDDDDDDHQEEEEEKSCDEL